MSREGKTTCSHSKKNWVLLSHVDARGKKLSNCTLRGISLGSSLEHCFLLLWQNSKTDVVCTYKMLYSDLVSSFMDVILTIGWWWTNQINPTYFMVNKFEHGMVISLDIPLKRTTIDVCRKHTNTGQCVLISSHEYWPRKIAWVRALLRQASHIQKRKVVLQKCKSVHDKVERYYR